MTKLKTAYKLLAAAATVVVAGFLASGTASAQQMLCTERSSLLKELNGKYQEHRQGLGIAAGNRGAMEFYASKEGTWTILMTLTDGRACIVAAGHSWQSAPELALGPEA